LHDGRWPAGKLAHLELRLVGAPTVWRTRTISHGIGAK
jgi:hypothetical protein